MGKTHFGWVEISLDGWRTGTNIRNKRIIYVVNYALKMGVMHVFIYIYFGSVKATWSIRGFLLPNHVIQYKLYLL